MSERPQRLLVYDMKIAIDRAIRMPEARYKKAVLRLVDLNPRNATSIHVRHNLGARRRARVDALLVEREAVRSLQEKESTDGQD